MPTITTFLYVFANAVYLTEAEALAASGGQPVFRFLLCTPAFEPMQWSDDLVTLVPSPR